MWEEGNDVEYIQRFGLEPVYSFEPIIVTRLGPGAYTALLSPSSWLVLNRPGIALIEIYSFGRLP
jgi:hypothetical protein